MSYLSKNLKYLRKRKQLTQQHFVDTYNQFHGVVVRRSTYQHWESGKTEPSLTHLIVLSDFFDTSIDEFLKIDIEQVEQDKATTWEQQDEYCEILDLLWISQIESREEVTF